DSSVFCAEIKSLSASTSTSDAESLRWLPGFRSESAKQIDLSESRDSGVGSGEGAAEASVGIRAASIIGSGLCTPFCSTERSVGGGITSVFAMSGVSFRQVWVGEEVRQEPCCFRSEGIGAKGEGAKQRAIHESEIGIPECAY